MDRQIEKHERVMGSEGVIPVSTHHVTLYISSHHRVNSEWVYRAEHVTPFPALKAIGGFRETGL